jgi:hypothetical protein
MIDNNGTCIAATSDLTVLHNIITNNTTVGLEAAGVSNVSTSDNTFYKTAGDNIRIEGGSSGVEVLNSILWAQAGYDIYVANDSQTGFFSDYNTLFAGPGGTLVYWTRNFTDILDWQDDVALYDLHSVCSTVVNPADGMPHFIDPPNNDFQLLPLVGGQQASDPALEQGSPIIEYDTQVQNGNLLANPGFENGLINWITDPNAKATVVPGNQPPYDGNGYFFASPNTASGYTQQQVSLLQLGYSAAQLDGGTLDVSFGGYTRSLPEATQDTGSITVTFIGTNGSTILAAMTVASTNTTAQWALTSDTTTLQGNRVKEYVTNG